MANTFELISSVTVGSGGAASIDFTSIPATYTDLCIKMSVRNTAAAVSGFVVAAFNGSTANFTARGVYGNGSSAASFSTPGNFVGELVAANATASTFSNLEMYIPNYAGSSFKSYSVDSVGENNGTSAQATISAGLWSVSTAINQVTLTPNTGTLVQYSTAYLYGVKNA